MLNWVVGNLQNAIETWNSKLSEIWTLVSQSPVDFKGGTIWNVITNIHGAVQAIALALLVLFFVVGVMKTCRKFCRSKKARTRIKTIHAICSSKSISNLWFGTYDGNF